jgi:hypothetical protein
MLEIVENFSNEVDQQGDDDVKPTTFFIDRSCCCPFILFTLLRPAQSRPEQRLGRLGKSMERGRIWGCLLTLDMACLLHYYRNAYDCLCDIYKPYDLLLMTQGSTAVTLLKRTSLNGASILLFQIQNSTRSMLLRVR